MYVCECVHVCVCVCVYDCAVCVCVCRWVCSCVFVFHPLFLLFVFCFLCASLHNVCLTGRNLMPGKTEINESDPMCMSGDLEVEGREGGGGQ